MSDTASTPPYGSTAAADEKARNTEHVEQVKTKERVPGHTNYYEKGGLRTYGDGEDHDHEPKVCAPSSPCSHRL